MAGRPISRDELITRFWRRVQQTDQCWLWTGVVDRYGQLKVRRRTVWAHRFSYELANGPVPDGLVIDHLCRNKICVRPDHLEAVPQGENVRRGRAASVGRCDHGFDFPMADGGRGCRTCQQAASTARYRARLAKRSAA